MISKKILLTIVCLLSISPLYLLSFYSDYTYQPKEPQSPSPKSPPFWEVISNNAREKVSNWVKPSETPLTPTTEPTTLPEEIGSWTATKALLRNTGRSIVGPIIEGTLGLIGYGLKGLSDALSGEENQSRRDTIYTGTAGALAAWSLYRLIRKEEVIPGFDRLKNWWNQGQFPQIQFSQWGNQNVQLQLPEHQPQPQPQPQPHQQQHIIRIN